MASSKPGSAGIQISRILRFDLLPTDLLDGRGTSWKTFLGIFLEYFGYLRSSYDPTAILIFWTVLEKEKVVLRGAKGPAADGRGCSSGVSAMMSASKKEEGERRTYISTGRGCSSGVSADDARKRKKVGSSITYFTFLAALGRTVGGGSGLAVVLFVLGARRGDVIVPTHTLHEVQTVPPLIKRKKRKKEEG
jgi:hypothetical protein